MVRMSEKNTARDEKHKQARKGRQARGGGGENRIQKSGTNPRRRRTPTSPRRPGGCVQFPRPRLFHPRRRIAARPPHPQRGRRFPPSRCDIRRRRRRRRRFRWCRLLPRHRAPPRIRTPISGRDGVSKAANRGGVTMMTTTTTTTTTTNARRRGARRRRRRDHVVCRHRLPP